LGYLVVGHAVLLDQVADDLVDLNHSNLAGPFAAGTGRDGFGQYDQRSACQSQCHETADGLSVGGWRRGGWKIRALALRLQSVTWTVWVA
jgi:hypothetical protein